MVTTYTGTLSVASIFYTNIFNGAQLDNVAANSFSGLLPNERYRIFDNGALTNVLTSDGSGGLSFAIALTNGAHSIRVEGPAGAIFTFR